MLINRLRFARPIQSFILPKESLFFPGGRGGGEGELSRESIFQIERDLHFFAQQ